MMSPSRLESFGERLANHEARIETVEKANTDVAAKLDRMTWWIIATLAATVATLAGMLVKQ